MTPAVQVSVVIVTFNSAACIEACVESVVRSLPGAEIIVVDNASADGTLRAAARASARARLLAQAENVGFGRACNLAAELASEPHILFVNPDTRLVSVDAAGLRAAVGERLFGVRGAALVDGGALVDREVSWGADVLRHAVGSLRPRELGPLAVLPCGGAGRWVGAAAMMVRRDEFLEVGGFDPRFFLYYEDRELSARYRDAGLPVEPLPAVVVSHGGGRSSGEDDLRAAPLAWEYLSWLEYVGVRGGVGRARVAELLTRGPRGLARRMVGALVGWGVGGVRLARKAEQLDAVARRLEALAGSSSAIDASTFCPLGRRLVAGGRRG